MEWIFLSPLRNPQDKVTDLQHEAIEKMRTNLTQDCETSLRLPKPVSQYVVMADTNCYSARNVLLTERRLYKRSIWLWNVRIHGCDLAPNFSMQLISNSQLTLKNFWRSILHSILSPKTIEKRITSFNNAHNHSFKRLFQAETIPSRFWTCLKRTELWFHLEAHSRRSQI